MRSSKRTQLKENLKECLLNIDNLDTLFKDDKSKSYYDKIFGTTKNQTGESNIRNQIAHILDLDFSLLPQWEEMHDYIEICDNVLKNIESNLKFID